MITFLVPQTIEVSSKFQDCMHFIRHKTHTILEFRRHILCILCSSKWQDPVPLVTTVLFMQDLMLSL